MLAFFSRTACNKKQGEHIYPKTLTRIQEKITRAQRKVPHRLNLVYHVIV